MFVDSCDSNLHHCVSHEAQDLGKLLLTYNQDKVQGKFLRVTAWSLIAMVCARDKLKLNSQN